MERPNIYRLEMIATTLIHEYLDNVDYPDNAEEILVDELDLTNEEAEYFGVTEKLAELEIELENE